MFINKASDSLYGGGVIFAFENGQRAGQHPARVAHSHPDVSVAYVQPQDARFIIQTV
jgi:hypothetical protein